jgi:hypothetical protein
VWSYAGLSDGAGLYYKAVDGGYEIYSGRATLTGEVEIPSTYNGQSVVAIGAYGFYNKANITSIEIPSSVSSIGSYTFYGCSSLLSIEIPSSVSSIGESAFSGCSSLLSVVIQNGVSSIGGSAFEGCSSLLSIKIPGSVSSIGSYAFYNCSKLTIYAGASTQPSGWSSSWNPSSCPVVWGYGELLEDAAGFYYKAVDGGYAIYSGRATLTGDIEIPSTYNGQSVVAIGENGFRNKANITSIVIPNSIKSIGEYAFAYCSSLTKIIIPLSVTVIGSYAFRDCSKLTIYARVSSEPSGWSYGYWNVKSGSGTIGDPYVRHTPIWNYKGN